MLNDTRLRQLAHGSRSLTLPRRHLKLHSSRRLVIDKGGSQLQVRQGFSHSKLGVEHLFHAPVLALRDHS